MRILTFKILIVVVLGLSVKSYSQERVTEVIYKKKSNVKLDYSNSSKNKSSIEIVEKAYSLLNNLNYSLIYNGNSSLFFEMSSLEIENENSIPIILAKSFGDTNGTFYTNSKLQSTIIQKEFDGEIFLIEKPFSNNNWQIEADQKRIGNYLCQKATKIIIRETISGSKQVPIVAWFTVEIPIPYGPASYVGLPGLILEVEVDNIVIYASKIIKNALKDKRIELPKNGKLITVEDFTKLEKEGFKYFKKF